VQGTTEATARPIITALTMMSADKNIDQGESSCSELGGALGDFPEAPAAAASLGIGAADDDSATGGGAVGGSATDVAAFCCANEGAADASIGSDSSASATNLGPVPNNEGFIAQPVSWLIRVTGEAVVDPGQLDGVRITPPDP